MTCEFYVKLELGSELEVSMPKITGICGIGIRTSAIALVQSRSDDANKNIVKKEENEKKGAESKDFATPIFPLERKVFQLIMSSIADTRHFTLH